MSSPARPLRLRHVNGSVDTDPLKIKVKRGLGQYLRISNTSGNDLLVSLNNGRDYYTIASGDQPLEVSALFHFIVVLGGAAATTYEALIGEG